MVAVSARAANCYLTRAPKHSKAMKAIENKLVPGLNPKKGDMKDFIAAQRRMYA